MSGDPIEVFTKVYTDRCWGDNGNPSYAGSSGFGSTLQANEALAPVIQDIIRDHRIQSVVDLGCGDFRAGRHIYGGLGMRYTGYDAYKGVVDNCNKVHSDLGTFVHADISCHAQLAPADLCVIKDVLQHWPVDKIVTFMNGLVQSRKYKHILIINTKPSWAMQPGVDIVMGWFRGLSALEPPLDRYNAKVLCEYCIGNQSWGPDIKEVSIISN